VSRTIYILNDDVFPHDESEKEDAVKIVKAFFQHIYHDLTSDTNLALCLRIYPALSWVVNQLVILLTLKVVIPNDDMQALAIVVGVFVVNTLIWHINMDMFEDIRLGGKARMILRRAILGTVIQLTTVEAERFPTGTALGILDTQVENCVGVCYLGALNIYASTILLVAMTGLSAYLTRKTPFILPIPFVMLIIDIVILYCRIGGQTLLYSKWVDQDNKVKALAAEISDQRLLCTTYRAGFKLECAFKEENAAQNKCRYIAVKYQQATEKMLKWNHTVFIIGVLVLGAFRCVEKVMSLPDYVIVLGTMLNFDREITLLFMLLFNAVNGYVSVNKVADILNSQTRRKALLQAMFRRNEIVATLEKDDSFTLDYDTITAYKLEYDYNIARGQSSEDNNDKDVKVDVGYFDASSRIGPLTLVLEQGQNICVQSKINSAGKKTFMRLLARQILPTSGVVIYPNNLRVRFIPAEPLMFCKSLMDNLKFGNQKPHEAAEIWELCEMLGMGKEIIGKSDIPVGLNGIKLSLTNRVFVSIARALLSSVDLLFLAGIVDNLNPSDGKKVMEILKLWRDNRGMPCLPCDNPEGVHLSLKKQKTCFFISTNPDLEAMADSTIMMKGTPSLSA